MTIVIYPTSGPFFADGTLDTVVLPSELLTADCVAAWMFYSNKDATHNGWDITTGSGASINADGAIEFTSGANAYATTHNLPIPAAFTFIASVGFPDTLTNAGAVFGNYVTSPSTAGVRLYSSTSGGGVIYFQIGDITGRVTLSVVPVGWIEIGVSVTADGDILICTEDVEADGTDTSPRGTAPARFGSSDASGVTVAANAKIAVAALYDTAKTVDEMRDLLAVAKTKRLSDGWGS